MKFSINPDIKNAGTLPASFYTDTATYERLKETVFVPSWQIVGTTDDLPATHSCYPVNLLEGCLNEPLVLTKDETGTIRCLSNVCTHRGFVLVEEACQKKTIRCRYHGRCFHTNGKMKSMPEFEEAIDFPRPEDDLPEIACENWGKLLFASIDPQMSMQELLGPIQERLAWFPMDELVFDPSSSQTYGVDAHWALYCDNYLEGFHVPYVHGRLNATLDYGNYTYETHQWCNLQLAIAKEGEAHFDLPESSPDYGKKIFAYYYWVYPNMMFNFYPWGLSLNIIKPKGIDKTEMVFLTFLRPGFKPEVVVDTHIHETEMEDEEVVASVQRGLRSRLYHKGRFSPKQERCVHHFHRLLARAANE